MRDKIYDFQSRKRLHDWRASRRRFPELPLKTQVKICLLYALIPFAVAWHLFEYAVKACVAVAMIGVGISIPFALIGIFIAAAASPLILLLWLVFG